MSIRLELPVQPTKYQAVPQNLEFETCEFLENNGDSTLYLPPLLSRFPDQTVDDVVGADKPAYTESTLPSIDDASIALHRALHSYKPITQDYARVPYEDAFNWKMLELPVDIEREWYAVAFRSTRAEGSANVDLYRADREAHEEAVANGGLISYWYGVPKDGRNLATCIWQSRAHAVVANSGPKHIKAMRLASKMYAEYKLERYVIRKNKGERNLQVLAWDNSRKEVSF